MAEISEAITMIKKAEGDADNLIAESKVKSEDMIKDAKVKADAMIADAKGYATHEAENTVFNAEENAKKEAHHISAEAETNKNSIKEKSMANVDDAASIIVKRLL